MTFAEMIAEIYIITNRADLVSETALSLRKATMKMHGVDYWIRDLKEIALAIAIPSTTVQVDVLTNMPRNRAIAYIRDASTGTPNTSSPIFTQIEPRAVLDEYHLEKQNVWYQGGSVINLRAMTAISNLLIGYYENPVILPEVSYSSWIAAEQPYTLIEEAAANVFRMTGNAEMAKFYENQSAQNVLLLRQNYLEGVAR